MPLTRPPLTLIAPVGDLNAGNPVKTDGRRLVVTEPDAIEDDLRLTSGSYDSTTGVLSLEFQSGRKIEISGFLTITSVGVGQKGEKGDSGRDGIDGVDGVNGRDGPRGWTGPQGLRGEKGDTGVQGPAGDRGDVGEKGEPGAPGQDYTT